MCGCGGFKLFVVGGVVFCFVFLCGLFFVSIFLMLSKSAVRSALIARILPTISSILTFFSACSSGESRLSEMASSYTVIELILIRIASSTHACMTSYSSFIFAS